MTTLRFILAVGFAFVITGCRSPNAATSFGQSIWGDFGDTKTWLADYKQVFLVCVYEDGWEDQGPHKYSLHHFKGTVVRTFSGDWKATDRVAFVHGVDAPARTETNAFAGSLLFLFTNQRTNTEFGVDAGEFLSYDSRTERQWELVFFSER